MANREELRTAPHLLPRDSKLQAHPARWMIRLIHLLSSMALVGAVACVWPNKKENQNRRQLCNRLQLNQKLRPLSSVQMGRNSISRRIDQLPAATNLEAVYGTRGRSPISVARSCSIKSARKVNQPAVNKGSHRSHWPTIGATSSYWPIADRYLRLRQ